MSNRLKKLQKDIDKGERSIQKQMKQQDTFRYDFSYFLFCDLTHSHRKARVLYNKDMELKISEKK